MSEARSSPDSHPAPALGSPHGPHTHSHHHQAAGAGAPRALGWALVLTASFMLVEAAAGLYAGSLALLADAGHMLADAGALGLALAAQRFARRARTPRSTYGFRRAEVLAAFVNGMTLAGVAVLVLKEAVERWLEPRAILGGPMLAVAVSGLVINLVVAAILMGGRRDSLNVRAAFLHVLSDALGSLAAIGAALCVLLWGLVQMDPILSALIAVLVAFSGFRILKETAGILLEGAPPHLDVAAIERTILSCAGVSEVHDLHVWRISERFDTLTTHIVLERGHHGTDVCRDVAECLREVHGLHHVTIQPEPPRPDEVVSVRRSRTGAPLERIR